MQVNNIIAFFDNHINFTLIQPTGRVNMKYIPKLLYMLS